MGIAADRFEELYDEYWALAYAVCRTRLGNDQEAADTCQDVFVRKWQARDRYDPQKASFKTWLVRNAVNACVDILRARARHPDEECLAEANGPVTRACDTAAIRHLIVTRCLADLFPETRQLVLMHAIEEYTWEEISAITGLTVSQARTRTAQGLDTLRESLCRNGIAAAL